MRNCHYITIWNSLIVFLSFCLFVLLYFCLLVFLWSNNTCIACKIRFPIKTMVGSSFFRYLYFPVFLVRMRRNTINHKGNILFAFLFSAARSPRRNICGISSFTFFTTMLSVPSWKTANILDLIFLRLCRDPKSTCMDIW